MTPLPQLRGAVAMLGPMHRLRITAALLVSFDAHAGCETPADVAQPTATLDRIDAAYQSADTVCLHQRRRQAGPPAQLQQRGASAQSDRPGPPHPGARSLHPTRRRPPHTGLRGRQGDRARVLLPRLLCARLPSAGTTICRRADLRRYHPAAPTELRLPPAGRGSRRRSSHRAGRRLAAHRRAQRGGPHPLPAGGGPQLGPARPRQHLTSPLIRPRGTTTLDREHRVRVPQRPHLQASGPRDARPTRRQTPSTSRASEPRPTASCRPASASLGSRRAPRSSAWWWPGEPVGHPRGRSSLSCRGDPRPRRLRGGLPG